MSTPERERAEGIEAQIPAPREAAASQVSAPVDEVTYAKRILAQHGIHVPADVDPRGKNIFQWQQDETISRRLDAIWNIISSPRSYSVHEIRGALAALCDAVATTSRESV